MQLDQAFSTMAQNPFDIITIIGAPAILTNASSILGLSTGTRLMKCLETIGMIEKKLEDPAVSEGMKEIYLAQSRLSYRQSRNFLRALRASYTSLAAFAFSCFVALVGSILILFGLRDMAQILAVLSLLSGSAGVLGLVWSSIELIIASKLTLLIMNKNLEVRGDERQGGSF